MIKAILKKEYIEDIKNDDRIITAIQLMRILKTIRYNQLLLLKSVEEEETGANIKFFILWNLAAALFEGIKTFYKLKKQFMNLKYYKKDYEKIDDILKEFGEQNSFTNSVLKVIRDKLAFHFDREVILEVIKEFTVYSIETTGEVVLFSGKTTAIKDLEYNIADNMDYNYIISLIETGDEDDFEKMKKIMKDVLSLTKKFFEILENSISELLEDIAEKVED